MSYSAIMTYIDADGAPEQRILLSAGLADKFKATLIGISAVAFRPPMMVEGVAIEGTTEAEIKEASAKLAGKGNWFRKIAGDGRKLEWRPVFDFPADALAREARSADLVVIGRTPGPGDPYSSLDPGGVLLRLGRPALVVPDGVSSLRAEHIVIGWKDTREARRAVQDSLPFLHEALSVTITEVCEAGGDEQAARGRVEDIVGYLGRHRINSRAVVIHPQGQTAASRLIQFVQNQGADLLVIGAYGHSRLGEWVFGGMTRDLLATSSVCCLMSH
jgi:nucleotide-binding universal stress UspA family protein